MLGATAGGRTTRKRVLRILSWAYPPLDSGITHYARQRNWIMRSFDLTEAPEAEALEQAHELPFDGVLAQLSRGKALVDFCRTANVPVVDIAEEHTDLSVPRVLLDEVAIGRMAGEHFVERGYRHFAFCSAYNHYALAGRLAGFREIAEPVSETFHVIRVRPAGESALPRPNGFARDLERLPRPLAVMAFDDSTGQLVVAACEIAGLLVPEQVSVVACNNSSLTELSDVRMSSVVIDFERQGHEAAALLDRLMAGEPAPDGPIRIPPVVLAIRESSDMFAVENIAVARAVRFIIQRGDNPDLRVDDVAFAAGVSRRHVENLFRQHLDRGVAEYVRDIRIRRAKNLLLQLSESVQEVGVRCGFRNASHFSRVFSAAVGQPPRMWRKKQPDDAS